ncbi:hypothetical protein [Plantibacter sp. YIM 135347]|uniref:hypothetical protein n=1 Tax=Plantibacter sp. YIM 135347 TaxID=3423919 RepID=UPI003D32AD8F
MSGTDLQAPSEDVMDADDLSEYVHAKDDDSAFVKESWDAAVALVDQRIKSAHTPVPQTLVERAYLEVGSELYHRRQAPNGIVQFATLDGGAPARVARDPMVAAASLLAPFLPLGFA